MKRFYSLLAALPMLTASAPAAAYCLMTTEPGEPSAGYSCSEEGIPLTWRRSCMGMAIDRDGSRDLSMDVIRGAVSRSFESWTRIECEGDPPRFEFRVEDELAECKSAYFEFGGANANTMAFVSDFEERGYDEAAFAVTVVWHSLDTGEIFDADMLVNEQFSPFVICSSLGCLRRNDIDFENVITHEAGHFFGLAHSDVRDATMYGGAPRGEISKRTLHEDDITGFCAAYPEPLPGECDFTPHGGFDATCPGFGEERDDGGCGCHAAPTGGTWLAAALLLLGGAGMRRRRDS